jgi:hypothetical protein
MSSRVPPTPIAEWRAEIQRRTSGSPVDIKLVCPLCGNVSSPREFREKGANPEKAFTNCIGRVIGAKGTLNSPKPTPQPCDWAAYGLFGTLSSGTELLLEDGTTAWVFSFAEDSEVAS